MPDLIIGTQVELESGLGSVTVLKKLGEGGQGYVYLVKHRNTEMALKWYKNGALKQPEQFRENLISNMKEKAPTSSFLWPIAITKKQLGSFGYIMNLRPGQYREFSGFLNGTCEFSSIDTMLKAAINIVDSFRILHNKGFSYQDLNDGNFFIDPVNGDVLICDNDNVSQFGQNSGIAGKCRYMAPAVVVGRKAPDKRTDQFSLAVVLFLLLLRNHPLEGAAVVTNPVMTEQMQKRYYGEIPVFIADPINASNRPVIGIHNNFISRWPQMPDYIQNAFIKAFSHDVMYTDKMGVTEKEWLRFLLAFRAEVVTCPLCGQETRYDRNGMACICCKQKIPNRGWLKTAHYQIPLFSGKEIVEAYITDSYDQNESSHLVARVTQNKDKSKIALQNKEKISWNINGFEVQPEKRYPITPGMKFRLKNETIEII